MDMDAGGDQTGLGRRRRDARRWPAAVVAGLVVLTAALALTAAAGCRRKQPAPPPPPPAPVTVATPIERSVIDWDEYTGYLAAPETVDLRARVSGLITAAPFEEGRIVRKGDLIYQIDPRPFQAELDAREAEVQRAQANESNRQREYDRQVEALRTNAVAQQQVDDARAALLGAQADVAAAQAAAQAARLNVEFCQVASPIDGRAGRRLVTPGNLVTGGQGTGTLLTTIVSVDPMYLYFEADEGSVLKYQRLAMEQRRVSARDARIDVYMQLANETGFPHKGVTDFVDNRVDPGTGTLQARGVFPNPGGFLTPGFFARLRMPGSGRYTARLVPDAAIATSQDVKYVLVVGPDDAVQFRPVKLGSLFGQLRAIAEGIGPDDRVVVNGQMRARPGAKVKPELRPIDPALFTPMVGVAATQPATQASTQPTDGRTAPASPGTPAAPTTAPVDAMIGDAPVVSPTTVPTPPTTAPDVVAARATTTAPADAGADPAGPATTPATPEFADTPPDAGVAPTGPAQATSPADAVPATLPGVTDPAPAAPDPAIQAPALTDGAPPAPPAAEQPAPAPVTEPNR